MQAPRPTSSIYADSFVEAQTPSRSSSFYSDDVHSDPFPFDDFLKQLSEPARGDNTATQSRPGENAGLPSSSNFGSEWNAVCKALKAASNLAYELRAQVENAEKELKSAETSVLTNRRAV